MASRMPCLSRWRTRSATSPNQGGVARTDSEEVWIITVVSAILFIYASFVRNKCFLLPQGCIFFSWLATCYNLVAQFVGYTITAAHSAQISQHREKLED